METWLLVLLSVLGGLLVVVGLAAVLVIGFMVDLVTGLARIDSLPVKKKSWWRK